LLRKGRHSCDSTKKEYWNSFRDPTGRQLVQHLNEIARNATSSLFIPDPSSSSHAENLNQPECMLRCCNTTSHQISNKLHNKPKTRSFPLRFVIKLRTMFAPCFPQRYLLQLRMRQPSTTFFNRQAIRPLHHLAVTATASSNTSAAINAATWGEIPRPIFFNESTTLNQNIAVAATAIPAAIPSAIPAAPRGVAPSHTFF
jgi:hypothetical protein